MASAATKMGIRAATTTIWLSAARMARYRKIRKRKKASPPG
jgi:cytidylate kinase